MNDTTLGVIRHALTFAGGLAVAYGYLTPDQAGQSTDLIVQLVGAAATLIGIAGSVWNKLNHKAAIQAATTGAK
jgi:hypothetical protein